jgi:glycosyltransferase involved in cell wall biosynthesis
MWTTIGEVMKLWLDVDDLFLFGRHSLRPSGIQRLTGEVYAAFAQLDATAVGFVVHDSLEAGFRVIDWPEVQSAYQNLTLGHRLLQESSIEQPRQGWTSIAQRLFAKVLMPSTQQKSIDNSQRKTRNLRDLATADDVLCSLGAPWHHPCYSRPVSDLVHGTGSRFALLVHDLIPLLHREFFEISKAPNFGPFMRAMLPLADVIMTNSRSTATDVLRWTQGEGLALKGTPHVIPIAHGFTRPPPAPLPQGLETGPFVLFVSTIETRKNHWQAFRVWIRLLQEMPRERVPTLVFAGSVGWMVNDLMKAIESTRGLDGKLILIHDPDDATLCALYRACLFTLFLSHYEGWGLPVSDSLSFGKVCVASNAASIPEAGGDFCLYVDPDNTTGAYEVIRSLIDSPRLLGDLEKRIASKFRPLPWSVTAKAVVQAVS